MSRTELYRHYDENGTLLYIGVSMSTITRLAGHRTFAKWFDRIVTITIEHFNSRPEALLAERKAIENEEPEFNVIHGNVPRSKSTVILGLHDVALRLGIKPGVLRMDVRYNRCAVPPLPNSKPVKWSVYHIDRYLAERNVE